MRRLFWNFRARLLAIQAYQTLPDLDFPGNGEECVHAFYALIQFHERKMAEALGVPPKEIL